MSVKVRAIARDDAKLLVPAEHVEQSLRDFPGAYDVDGIQIFHAVRALAQRMNDGASEWLAPFGLSAAKFNYLAVLYARRRTGLSPNDLGALVHTVSGTVTSMIDALARDGLVRRDRHPSDGRSTIVRLTPKGERLFIRAADTHHRNISAPLEGLAPADRRRLLALLLRLGNALTATSAVRRIS
jgi:DNA-binding MarR family transcriptional regulator